MRIAKALFEHAKLARALLDQYERSRETGPAPFRIKRPLFDAGETAFRLLQVVDDRPAVGPVPVRRALTETWLDEPPYVVHWKKATDGEQADGYAHGLADFRSMNSLFESLYSAQMATKKVLPPTWFSVKLSDDPFRLEQLAMAMLTGLKDIFGWRKLSLIEYPVLAVASGIDADMGPHPLEALLVELDKRSTEWSKKPKLVGRRRPLQGRLRFTDLE